MSRSGPEQGKHELTHLRQWVSEKVNFDNSVEIGVIG
jgi:hypothetical protein